MSVAKVVTASGDLVIPEQSIIYGIHINIEIDPTGSGMSSVGNVTLFNAATQAAGTATNTVINCPFFSGEPKLFSYIFPAGIRCLKGGSITIQAGGADAVNVTIDYS